MAGRYFGALWRRSCSSSAAPAVEAQGKPGFRERMKNKKFVIWTKGLLHDYGEACKDIAVGVKERPGKAAAYISLLAGAAVCSSKAPTEHSFQCSLLEASCTLLLLSPWTRSGRSDQHVQRLMELQNEGRLRHINFLVFSLMYEAPYDAECDLYPTHCPHLKPRLSDFPSRVLDIGFFGHWWLLQQKMKDFDINEEDFSHLPAHMRTISYNNLHTLENERLYELKFNHVVMKEDDIPQDQRVEEPITEDRRAEEQITKGQSQREAERITEGQRVEEPITEDRRAEKQITNGQREEERITEGQRVGA